MADFDILDEMRQRAFAALVPPPQIPLSEWIEASIVLPEGLCACPGPVRLYPYQRAIADAIGDPDIERVTLQKAARIGFSVLVAAAIGHYCGNDPKTASATGASVEDTTSFFVAMTNNLGLSINQLGAAADMVEGIANKAGNRIRGGPLALGLADVSLAVSALNKNTPMEGLAYTAAMIEALGKKTVKAEDALEGMQALFDGIRTKGKGMQGLETFLGTGAMERNLTAGIDQHKDLTRVFLKGVNDAAGEDVSRAL
jgi:Phage terminase large subunit (GpA)